MLQSEACTAEKRRQDKLLKTLRNERAAGEASIEQLDAKTKQLNARAVQLKAELESVEKQAAETVAKIGTIERHNVELPQIIMSTEQCHATAGQGVELTDLVAKAVEGHSRAAVEIDSNNKFKCLKIIEECAGAMKQDTDALIEEMKSNIERMCKKSELREGILKRREEDVADAKTMGPEEAQTLQAAQMSVRAVKDDLAEIYAEKKKMEEQLAQFTKLQEAIAAAQKQSGKSGQ
jgi:septal ring factor EnvC (AmiA/AmiB activator)